MAAQLPIDELLPALVSAVADGGSNAVVVAPPGSGKTTRVPPALFRAGAAGDGDIVVVQPRRLAARMAAMRVAFERGEPVGQTCGYEVRFDRKVSAATRIRFVTEGVLTRRLVGEPTLPGVGVVIFDEVHERHLASDVGMSLARRLQQHQRPDLRLVAMSATVDPGPLAAFLGCDVFESDGSLYPVAIEYLPNESEWRLGKHVSAAVRRLVKDGLDGDVLVFLPGAREIRDAMRACTDIAATADLLVLPLHGDLSAAEQDRAVAAAARRKLILATNVAETSITIDGVVAVIDSGLARIPRHSPWSGIASLQVEPISQASCAQRAGRAGRTRPGRCLRLFGQHDHDTRREHEVAEVRRADLSGALLELCAAGVRHTDLHWFEAPDDVAVAAAEDLLRRLGAVDADFRITPTGRAMARFPLHPRLARVMVEAEARGVARDMAGVVAVVGERSSRRLDQPPEVSGASDLLVAAERPSRSAKRAGKQIARIADSRRAPLPKGNDAIADALLISLLTGYPDRVARRRAPNSRELLLASGSAVTLARSSVVVDAELMIAVSAQARGQGSRRATLIDAGSAIEAEWLLDLYADAMRDSDELQWNRDAERVDRVTRLMYESLSIDEQRTADPNKMDAGRAAALLADQALSAGLDRLFDMSKLDDTRNRFAFAHQNGADTIPEVDDDFLATVVRRMATGCTRFAELRKQSLAQAVRDSLDYNQRQLLDNVAPEAIKLPGRKRVPVHYEADRPPWIESRLQDFFGLREGPAIARGAVPLVLHLLAPNFRAVQVTQDLAGFWQRHYPDLRRQLSRRYPKHKWPENPV